MPLEIRELVVKASVVKNLRTEQQDFITKHDFRRLRQEIIDEIMDRVESLLEDSRDRR